MRRLITLFFLVFTLSGVAFAQQMSDDQVVQYVKSAQQMGKNQKQITTELMRRGVTKEQVERIQKKYENSKSGSPQSSPLPEAPPYPVFRTRFAPQALPATPAPRNAGCR